MKDYKILASAIFFLGAALLLAKQDTQAAPGPYQTGALFVATSSTAMGQLAPGTAGHVLTSNGAGVVPSYQAAGSSSAAFPVGSVYISTSSTNPATTLGYGTWVAFGTGRVLVGIDGGDADFDTDEETGGAKTVTAAGINSAPTFTGSAMSTHAHGAGTLVPNAHSGTAVGDHAAHTHSVTSNVTVSDHAAHTHTFTAASTSATPDLVTSNTAGSGVAPAGTTGNPSATLTHAVTNNAVTSGNPSATLTHSVTQPSTHTMSGSSEAVSAGTPAGSVSAPTFTGSATSVVQPYIVVRFWKRTA